MDIIIRPDNISLVGSMKRVVVSTKEEITFILSYAENGAPIVQHTYTPDGHGRIEISLEDIIAPLLYFELQDVENAYLQNHIARDFKVTIRYEGEKTKAFTFTAIRAGVDRLADSAENFLKGNFLTWQPSVKPVTYNTPEFLTYYALTEGFVKCVGYHTERIVGLVKGDEKTIANLQKNKAQTIPVQYAIMAKLFGFLPEYYDVWVEDTEGKRLTYIQRYYASDIRSEEEQWILFENSLGGIDTFRAYGDTTLTAKHTHNIAEIENDAEEYRVDTTREYKKNTGHLNKEERRWLLDFFPSLGKYVYIDNYVRRIVVTDSEASYEAKELPSNFEFTFKYADARPYLNLRRSAVPAKMMDIKVPELGSFTIAPRLVEFQRLNLSSGALFPVQNPYADEWNVTTIAAIIDFIVEVLEKSYSANGGIGHTHDNFSLLQSLSLLNGYLLENGNKIKAGYADKARDLETPVDDRFLSKLKSDTARGLITFLKGIAFKNGGIDSVGNASLNSVQIGDFVSKLSGGIFRQDIDGTTYLETDRLLVRVKAYFESLEIVKLQYSYSNRILGKGGVKVTKVDFIDTNGNTTEDIKSAVSYRCYFLAEQDGLTIHNPFNVDDQAFVKEDNLKAGTTEHATNHYLWRAVTDIGENYVDLSPTVCLAGSDIPLVGDNLCQLGYRGEGHPDRTCAIMESTSGENAPSYIMLQGITDFSLNGKEVLMFGFNNGIGKAFFKVYGDSYTGNKERTEYFEYKDGKAMFSGEAHFKAGSTGGENIQGITTSSANLIINSGFVGNYETRQLEDNTPLKKGTEMYSPSLFGWNGTAKVVSNQASMSGCSVILSDESISQPIKMGLSIAVSYAFSCKAKGNNLTVRIGGYEKIISLTSDFQTIKVLAVPTGGNILELIGDCELYEPMLVVGNVFSTWQPSPLDNNKATSIKQAISYLQEALENDTTINGGLLLSTLIKVGRNVHGKWKEAAWNER